jgi:hypothetical protein
MINLLVEPNVSGMSWEDFTKNKPKYSIALDGYVNVGPRFDSNLMMINFNHHEEVDRLATRATCGQCLMAIRQGMYDAFRENGEITANVFVNDCDEDVCTSWFLINNSHLVSNTINPLVNKLVFMEDALDSTAGAYPFSQDLPSLKELGWIFKPYRKFRLDHGLDKRDPEEFKDIIYQVEDRIIKYVTGNGKTISLNTEYNVIHQGSCWSMVEEIGMHARTGMFGRGIKIFVSVRKNPNSNSYNYVIGKLSAFIPINLVKICDYLNSIDKNVAGSNKWGGADNVIGSPRNGGSSITPNEITLIMENFLQ